MKKMYCRLAVLMAEKNPQLSQRQLAKETNLDITTINRLFTNRFSRVDTHTVEVLCDYFQKGVGDLLELREVQDIPKRQPRKRTSAQAPATTTDEATPKANLPSQDTDGYLVRGSNYAA